MNEHHEIPPPAKGPFTLPPITIAKVQERDRRYRERKMLEREMLEELAKLDKMAKDNSWVRVNTCVNGDTGGVQLNLNTLNPREASALIRRSSADSPPSATRLRRSPTSTSSRIEGGVVGLRLLLLRIDLIPAQKENELLKRFKKVCDERLPNTRSNGYLHHTIHTHKCNYSVVAKDDDGRVVGGVTFRLVRDKDRGWLIAEVLVLAVDERDGGRGHATRMVNYVKSLVRHGGARGRRALDSDAAENRSGAQLLGAAGCRRVTRRRRSCDG